MTDAIINKLKELGFVNGLYGTAPYKLFAMESDTNDEACVMVVVMEDWQLGTISVTRRGTFMIDLDFGRWLRYSKDSNRFVFGMDLASKADRVVVWTYAKADAEVTQVLIKNRWGNTGPL
jgi:hypothetical protein